jgi:hypothetical protein
MYTRTAGGDVGGGQRATEANAALRSIVRRDTGETYNDFLTKLTQASGIETPTRADLAKLDRKRKKKGSNDDWTHRHDPDARIAKMKNRGTHLAHKAEHAVDLETGAIVAVTLQEADQGDTTAMQTTLPEAIQQLQAVTDDMARTGTNSSPTRALVASKPCSMYSPWDCAPTSVNQIAVGSIGSISTPSATRCMLIAFALRAIAGSS